MRVKINYKVESSPEKQSFHGIHEFGIREAAWTPPNAKQFEELYGRLHGPPTPN